MGTDSVTVRGKCLSALSVLTPLNLGLKSKCQNHVSQMTSSFWNLTILTRQSATKSFKKNESLSVDDIIIFCCQSDSQKCLLPPLCWRSGQPILMGCHGSSRSLIKAWWFPTAQFQLPRITTSAWCHVPPRQAPAGPLKHKHFARFARNNAAPSVEEFLKCLERRAKREALRKSPVEVDLVFVRSQQGPVGEAVSPCPANDRFSRSTRAIGNCSASVSFQRWILSLARPLFLAWRALSMTGGQGPLTWAWRSERQRNVCSSPGGSHGDGKDNGRCWRRTNWTSFARRFISWHQMLRLMRQRRSGSWLEGIMHVLLPQRPFSRTSVLVSETASMLLLGSRLNGRLFLSCRAPSRSTFVPTSP